MYSAKNERTGFHEPWEQQKQMQNMEMNEG